MPRARLALDEHGHGEDDHPRRLGRELADGRALAEEGVDGLPRLRGLARQRDLPHAPVLEGALDDDEQGGQLHRLGEELLGSLLDRLHREIDGAVAGEEDHGQGGVLGLQGAQHVEAVAVGQGEVHDRRVHRLLAQRLPGRGQAVRLEDLVALAAQEAPQGKAHVVLVVHEEDRALRHRASLRAGPGRRGGAG